MSPSLTKWKDTAGKPIDCAQKMAVLEENMQELTDIYRDFLDDALLMGCGQEAVRDTVLTALAAVQPTVKERAS